MERNVEVKEDGSPNPLVARSTDWPGTSIGAPVGIGALREAVYWLSFARRKAPSEFSPKKLRAIYDLQLRAEKLLRGTGYLLNPLW